MSRKTRAPQSLSASEFKAKCLQVMDRVAETGEPVLVWLAEGRPDLGARAVVAVDEALRRDALLVSAISFWEIAMLAQKKRLVLALEPIEFRRVSLSLGIREIAVCGDIGIEGAMLHWRGPGRRISARR